MLIDRQQLRRLYVGSIRLAPNTFSQFHKNLTNLRCEVSARAVPYARRHARTGHPGAF